MAKELMMETRRVEEGFILATSLVLLLLLTMLSIAVYFATTVSQKTSSAAQASTEAFYYAETAINYVAWALRNDVEFDSYTYPQAVRSDGSTSFAEPSARGALPDPYAVGDRSEWFSNMGNPSGEDSVVGAFDGRDYFGDIMYYDNALLSKREIVWDSVNKPKPDFYRIAERLPRFIKLEIDEYSNITPSLPIYYSGRATTHDLPKNIDEMTGPDPDVAIPYNGAIVWLTGGDQDIDRAMFPIDMYAMPFLDEYSYSIVSSSTSSGQVSGKRVRDFRQDTGEIIRNPVLDAYGVASTYSMVDGLGRVYPDPLGAEYDKIPCDLYALDSSDPASRSNPARSFNNNKTITNLATQAVACDRASPNVWLVSGEFGLVAYAIGYVHGKARKMIRMVLFF